ncbi:MAG TPA: hypothetical protein VHB77_03290 [Planctomycetaceae bacterium]|nr:hypothetical protein [Planctomycetaceae bacterium]
MLEFRGQFETHVTVEPRSIHELISWAEQRGLKCLQIELARGVAPLQPMLTWRGTGLLSDQMDQLKEICTALRRDGFRVIRSKVEASTSNQDVPLADDAATSGQPARYFEHHVKLLLPGDTDAGSLTDIAVSHQAHLSANALRQRDDGYHERFVTQRCWNVGRRSAQASLNALLRSLRTADFNVIDVEAEYVVYDSNQQLDSGWLIEEESRV